MATSQISLLQFAWKSVSRKIFRNIVLILTVSGLVCLLVFALLFKKTVTDDIQRAGQRLGADIVIVPAKAQTMAEEFILESKEKTFYMDDFLITALTDLEGIRQLNSHIYLDTLDAECCSIDAGQVIVFDSGKDFVVAPWLAENSPAILGRNEILVGSYVYEYLGLMNTAALFGQDVKVVGHLKETGTGLDHGLFLDRSSFAEISPAILANYRPGTTSILFLKLEPGYELTEMVAKIRDINPKVGIMTRGSIGADVRSTLADMIKIFAITILIAAILAALMAWSTFTAIANERRREIGVLRALGARKVQIIRLFLIEAGIIALCGGIIGVALGHWLTFFVGSDFHLLSRLDAESVFSLASLLVSAMALLIGVLVCFTGALIPILRISTRDPLQTIQGQ
ncbi:ABC transporter permease [Desulfogranum mediterraneum]|uniref:ABC transporter permease n=1 Tax=Desulfogranum mediterraneum TaxID=160661 RepID=UPI0003F837C6|nr:ABC transporter permease [Desulfogranum mediterraneum]